MVVLFVNENDFCYYRNCLYNHKYKFNSEKEQVNESQYIVSRPDSIRIRHSGRIRNRGVTYILFITSFIPYHLPYTFHFILYITSCSCNCILSSHSSAMLLISCHIFSTFHLHIPVIFFYVSCLHKP